MSQDNNDKYERWFEQNEADLRERFIEAHIGIFSEWAYDLWVNVTAEENLREDR